MKHYPVIFLILLACACVVTAMPIVEYLAPSMFHGANAKPVQP